MARVLICEICGNKFSTNKPHKKYCSLSCQEAGRRLARMKWNDKNQEYNKSYWQNYKRKS